MPELEQIAELGFEVSLFYTPRTEKAGGSVWVIRIHKGQRAEASLEDASLFSLIGRALSIARTLNG